MRNNVRELRKNLDLRQEDLAVLTGVTRQTINAIENAKYDPSLALAIRLARLLDTTVEELFTPDDLEKLDVSARNYKQSSR